MSKSSYELKKNMEDLLKKIPSNCKKLQQIAKLPPKKHKNSKKHSFQKKPRNIFCICFAWATKFYTNIVDAPIHFLSNVKVSCVIWYVSPVNSIVGGKSGHDLRTIILILGHPHNFHQKSMASCLAIGLDKVPIFCLLRKCSWFS